MRKVLLTIAAGMLTFLSLGFIVPGTASAQQQYPPLTSCYNELMDIGVGDPCVGSVQLALNSLNISNPPLKVDHIYGNATKSDIEAFQDKYGLAKDGVAGRATITKLFEATHAPQPTDGPAPAPQPTDGPGGAATKPPGPRCTYAETSAPIMGNTGQRVAAFNMKIHYCWDGENVTQPPDQPIFWCTVTALGEVAGWKFDKPCSGGNGMSVTKATWAPPGVGVWRNPPPWVAYDVDARAHFEQCPPGISWALPCVGSKTPELKLNLHGDGTYIPSAFVG